MGAFRINATLNQILMIKVAFCEPYVAKCLYLFIFDGSFDFSQVCSQVCTLVRTLLHFFTAKEFGPSLPFSLFLVPRFESH